MFCNVCYLYTHMKHNSFFSDTTLVTRFIIIYCRFMLLLTKDGIVLLIVRHVNLLLKLLF